MDVLPAARALHRAIVGRSASMHTTNRYYRMPCWDVLAGQRREWTGCGSRAAAKLIAVVRIVVAHGEFFDHGRLQGIPAQPCPANVLPLPSARGQCCATTVCSGPIGGKGMALERRAEATPSIQPFQRHAILSHCTCSSQPVWLTSTVFYCPLSLPSSYAYHCFGLNSNQ